MGISIRPPRAGRDLRVGCIMQHMQISIRPPRAGRDCEGEGGPEGGGDFNPPAPCGAGREMVVFLWQSTRFQSARPVRGGTFVCHLSDVKGDISIRPPRAGRDASFGIIGSSSWAFQSARPVRGGTYEHFSKVPDVANFNPPAPCGAGPFAPAALALEPEISIRPPRAGRDPTRLTPLHVRSEFQSARPVRGGTTEEAVIRHADLVFQSARPVRGGTSVKRGLVVIWFNFNPPAPCGAGQQPCTKFHLRRIAQCTIQ